MLRLGSNDPVTHGVTAKNAEGSSVTTNKNGTTNANGVVVDPKKGTVSVPGVGTFATPPGAQ